MAYPWVESSGRNVTWDPQGQGFGSHAPAVIQALKDLVPEVTEEQIERDKPGHRGLFLHQFQGILARCDEGDPQDPRWDELRLRCLDRMAKLLRVYEPDAPAVRQGPGDARILAAQAAAGLLELEASLSEVRVPGSA